MVEASKHGDLPMQQTRLAMPARPDRTGICFRARFIAVVLIGIAVWCQPAAAAVCRVPAAVLCEGCVERLSIRVAPDGACRISFTPTTPPEQVGSTKFVDINIETAPPRSTIHRVSAPHPSITGHPARLRESAVCFVFNGRRFCE